MAVLCRDPAEYSNTLTAVVMPEGFGSDDVLKTAESRFNLSLGTGLSRLKNRVFRIGHLGALNELEVLATLGGVELALNEVGVPLRLGEGVAACERLFAARVPSGNA